MKPAIGRLRLRKAVPEDLARLRYWDEQPHVIEADPNDDWCWERELCRDPDWREQLIAEVDDAPIGVIQIIDPAREDSHYWGDCPDDLRAIDIWIGEQAYVGRGFGKRMMEMAIDRCFRDPSVQAVLLDPLAANTRARRFYERLGFRFVENRRFGNDDCAVYALDRAAWSRRAAPNRESPPGRSDVADVRDATVLDCQAVTDLCLRSKASWGYDERFMEQSRQALTAERVERWVVRVAESRDGTCLGVAAFSMDSSTPTRAELELMFVEPEMMGTGVGDTLMRDLVDRLRECNVATLWILSDPGAEAFYLRYGATRVGLQASDAIAGRKLPWLRLDIDGPTRSA